MDPEKIARMKWPAYLIIVRHGESEYNILKNKKENDPLYQQFKHYFDKNSQCWMVKWWTKHLAKMVYKKYSLGYGDNETPLTERGRQQAFITGERMKHKFDLPDIIFRSPYVRTKETLEEMTKGWPELANVKTYEDKRLREQEHGLATIYNDWRVFETLHPEQRVFHNQAGSYWYQYLQGESGPQVSDRQHSMISTIIREFANKKILLVTHHLVKLAMRAELERLSAEEFIRLDEKEKPKNCGLTFYRGNPEVGQNGHLELIFYNECLY